MSSSSKTSAFAKATKNVFKMFDLYGQNVNLFINKKSKFHSTASGFISIGIIFVIIYAFAQFIASWLNGEKMTIIPSAISYSIAEILAKNMTFAYDFDYHNYYLYFVFYATLPNGTDT